MSDETLATYKSRFSDIDARLDTTLADPDRAKVKGEIITLFKSVEQQVCRISTVGKFI